MIKALIWKEWRNQRAPLIGMLAFGVLPYIIIFVILVATQKHYAHAPARAFQVRCWEGLLTAAIAATYSMVVLTPFISGNAIAGERGGRNNEFLAAIPCSRMLTVVVKLALSMILIAIPLVVHTLLSMYGESNRYPGSELHKWLEHFAPSASMILCGLGSAWCASAIFRNATTSAAIGLGVLLLVGFGVSGIGIAFDIHDDQFFRTAISVTNIFFGIAGLIAGTVVALRRLVL